MYLLFLLLISSITHADISKLRAYPSEITVTFNAAKPIIIPEKISARERKKYENMEPEILSYQRFVRIVNALTDDSEVFLEFYHENNELISQVAVTNSSQPSPKYIFFMDRDSGRKFNGVLDAYHIPKDAHYFQIVAYKDNVKHIATHPDFEKNDRILISQYENPNDERKLMLQLELLGISSNITVRLGIFYFPRLYQ